MRQQNLHEQPVYQHNDYFCHPYRNISLKVLLKLKVYTL